MRRRARSSSSRPGVHRQAVATAPATTMLVVGGHRGERDPAALAHAAIDPDLDAIRDDPAFPR
jgi:hypothetical protein